MGCYGRVGLFKRVLRINQSKTGHTKDKYNKFGAF